MWLYYLAILLAIISNVFYHIIQKSTPHNVNPLVALTVTYMMAAITCLIILPFYPHKGNIIASFKNLNWTSVTLGVAIVGLELGFLLAYRAGGNISTAVMLANIIVALILIPIGLLLFKESLKLINVVGVLLCVLGLVLINRK